MTTFRKGLHLLPNLFTTAGLLAGFYAIVTAVQGQFTAAVVAVFIAIALDGLDGLAARLTHSESVFGAHFDSLTDMVAFGLAPALILYQWVLTDVSTLAWEAGYYGWPAAFIYTAAAALRLARFNAQSDYADERYFVGLPSTSAAALMAGLVWIGDDLGMSEAFRLGVAVTVTLLASGLMVSKLRYFSFKRVDLKGWVYCIALVAIGSAFVLASIDPPKVLFAGFVLYGLSGPVLYLLRRRRTAAATCLPERDKPD